jgi:hypothetical protein
LVADILKLEPIVALNQDFPLLIRTSMTRKLLKRGPVLHVSSRDVDAYTRVLMSDGNISISVRLKDPSLVQGVSFFLTNL